MSVSHLPTRIGPYLLIHRIGEGGLADVYLALRDGKSYAVKCLKPERAAAERFVSDFVREVKIASSLSHPNILNVVDHGKVGDTYYAVMDLVVGTTLGQLLDDCERKKERIPLPFSLYVLNECVKALSYLHQTTVFSNSTSVVFHGDLSPDNILLSQDGKMLLMDFGSAGQVTAADPREHHLGKMYYLPAEVMENKSVTTVTDIYSLAVIAYYLFFGSRPFEGKDKFDLYKTIRRAEVPRKDASELVQSKVDEVTLRIFFNKALNKNPQIRFQSVDEFHQALSSIHFSAGAPKNFAEVHEYFTTAAAKRLSETEATWSSIISNYRLSEKTTDPVKKPLPVESLLAKTDLRKHPRVQTVGQNISAEVDVRQKKFKANFAVHELSQGGMLAKCEGIKPQSGEVYSIVLNLDDGGVPIRAKAKIVYTVTKTSKTFAGFQFTELPPMVDQRLSDYVLSHLSTTEHGGEKGSETDSEEGHLDIYFSSVEEFRSEFEKNIQHGGMFLKSPRALKDNEPVVVRIQLPKGLRRVLLTGKVVYCKTLDSAASEEKHGVGIQLNDSQPKLRELFSDLVS